MIINEFELIFWKLEKENQIISMIQSIMGINRSVEYVLLVIILHDVITIICIYIVSDIIVSDIM